MESVPEEYEGSNGMLGGKLHTLERGMVSDMLL